MHRIDIANLLASAANVAVFSDKLASSLRDFDSDEVVRFDLRGFGRVYLLSVETIGSVAKTLRLSSTAAAALRCKSSFGALVGTGGLLIGKSKATELVTHSHQLTIALSDELAAHHSFTISPVEGALIDRGVAQFGEAAVTAFPAIRKDVEEGSKCRAYELWTAAVMHMMRVAEVGVAALADHLEVTRGPSWGVTINNVLVALNGARGAKHDPALRQWASETATYLNFVKDAFRNPAMHPEMSFDREQAISTFENTRAFMRSLALHLRASQSEG